MIYFFHGDDSFSASEALATLAKAVGSDDVREANVSQLEGGSFNLAAFGTAAMVVPFLADRRLVVVRGLLASLDTPTGGRRGRKPAARGDALGPAAGLPALLGQLPETTDVVFIEVKVGRGNVLLAEIEALGTQQVQIRDFPALRREPLVRWVRERAAAKGATIDSAAVELLVELVGGNLWAMDNELEKLAIYRMGETIEAVDVGALVSGARETTVFELVDALMEGRAEAAMLKMEALLQEGAGGPYLLSMIARQARMLALAHELDRERVPQGEWGGRLGTTSDFVVRKTAEQARRFPFASVRLLYGLLVEADLAMKTGEATEEIALAELIARGVGLRHGAPLRR